jgi:hypothetical protein
LFFYVATAIFDLPSLTNTTNFIGPLSLGLSCFFYLYLTIKERPELIVTPYIWFILSILLFYSIGPLIYPLSNNYILDRINNFLPISPNELLRTNILNTIGIIFVILGFFLTRKLTTPFLNSFIKYAPKKKVPIKVLSVFFLLIGASINFLVILPYKLKLLNFILPGIIQQLSGLYPIGLLLIAFLIAKGKKAWRTPFFILLTIQIIVSLLLLSKKDLILNLALPSLGFYLGNRSIKQLIFYILLSATIYFSMQNLILYSRNEIYLQSGDISKATLSQRAEIIHDYFIKEMPLQNSKISSFDNAWSRLNYANVQAFAMKRYDDGIKGETLQDIFIVFIPRVLWADKPSLTDMAIDFYELVTLRRGTHLGLGIFGESYWNYGWLGVIIFCFITGSFFSLMSYFSIHWIHKNQFEYLPSVFIGINIGLTGPTQFFINGILGQSGFFFVYSIFVTFLFHLFFAKHIK